MAAAILRYAYSRFTRDMSAFSSHCTDEEPMKRYSDECRLYGTAVRDDYFHADYAAMRLRRLFEFIAAAATILKCRYFAMSATPIIFAASIRASGSCAVYSRRRYLRDILFTP
jgi:hypothetical protein